jgi:hypothetical protein
MGLGSVLGGKGLSVLTACSETLEWPETLKI